MTNKEKLIKHLNELREKHDLPPYDPNKLTMTTEEIEKLVDHLQNGVHSDKEPAQKELLADTLARYNVLRKRAKEKPIGKWTQSAERLRDAIDLIQLDLRERAQEKTVKAPTKIAKGAATRRKNTDLHINPIREDMVRMRKRQDSQRKRELKDKAKKIALWAGFHAANVRLYLEAQTPDSAVLAGEPLKAAIKAFLESRALALPQKRRGKPKTPLRAFLEAEASRLGVPEKWLGAWLAKNAPEQLKPLNKAQEKKLRAFAKDRPKLAAARTTKRYESGSITPHEISAATGLDAKQVRVRLRKLEQKIKAAWRVEGERWGFKKEHSADIIKLVKGE